MLVWLTVVAMAAPAHCIDRECEQTHEAQQEEFQNTEKEQRYRKLGPTFILWDAYSVHTAGKTTDNEEECTLTQQQFEHLVVEANRVGVLRIDLSQLGAGSQQEENVVTQAFVLRDSNSDDRLSMSEVLGPASTQATDSGVYVV